MTAQLASFCAFGAVLVQAFFVAAEVALTASDRRAMAALTHARARAATALLARMDTALATTLFGANIAGVAAVSFAAIALAGWGVAWYWTPLMVLGPLLVIGHLVPKGLAAAHADRTLLWLARPLRLWGWLLAPAVWLATRYAAMLHAAASPTERGAFVTRDELAMLIEADPVGAKPAISAEQREMIANVFELSEYTLRELMVPLSEITALPETTSLAESAAEVAAKQHSRMPVFRDRIDNVTGIVHVFEILAAVAAADGVPGKLETPISALAHPPIYVPETMLASDLLVELQKEGQHLAVVVDEYGGAVGIVTIEDLLETIVGEIDDEHDREALAVATEIPGVWRVDAKASVERLNLELGMKLPISDEYETVAGLLLDHLRRIPDVGDLVTLADCTIEVTQATDRAVTQVRVKKNRNR